jgi:hypothetical protein
MTGRGPGAIAGGVTIDGGSFSIVGSTLGAAMGAGCRTGKARTEVGMSGCG